MTDSHIERRQISDAYRTICESKESSKAFDIPTITNSLKADLEAGNITLTDAAEELFRAGWTNFVDVKATARILGVEADSANVEESSVDESEIEGKPEVFTIEVYDEEGEEEHTPMKYAREYDTLEDALEAAKLAYEEMKDIGPGIVGRVFGGEYRTEQGIFGEPVELFTIRDGKVYDITGDEYGVDESDSKGESSEQKSDVSKEQDELLGMMSPEVQKKSSEQKTCDFKGWKPIVRRMKHG